MPPCLYASAQIMAVFLWHVIAISAEARATNWTENSCVQDTKEGILLEMLCIFCKVQQLLFKQCAIDLQSVSCRSLACTLEKTALGNTKGPFVIGHSIGEEFHHRNRVAWSWSRRCWLCWRSGRNTWCGRALQTEWAECIWSSHWPAGWSWARQDLRQ